MVPRRLSHHFAKSSHSPRLSAPPFVTPCLLSPSRTSSNAFVSRLYKYQQKFRDSTIRGNETGIEKGTRTWNTREYILMVRALTETHFAVAHNAVQTDDSENNGTGCVIKKRREQGTVAGIIGIRVGFIFVGSSFAELSWSLLVPPSYHFVIFTRYQALNVCNKLDESKCPDPRKHFGLHSTLSLWKIDKANRVRLRTLNVKYFILKSCET